jgi:hypothetical protein
LLISLFFINPLVLNFLSYIFNIKRFFSENLRQKKRIQSLGGCQSWHQWITTNVGRFWITFVWWIIWLWNLRDILKSWFTVHGKNFKVKYQFLISLEAFKVGKLEIFPIVKPKTPNFLSPYYTYVHEESSNTRLDLSKFFFCHESKHIHYSSARHRFQSWSNVLHTLFILEIVLSVLGFKHWDFVALLQCLLCGSMVKWAKKCSDVLSQFFWSNA